MAQSVERVLGKDEVTSSNLVSSSKNPLNNKFKGFFISNALAKKSQRLAAGTSKAAGYAGGS